MIRRTIDLRYSLRDRGLFLDVTLAARSEEDGNLEMVVAHKSILSSSSPVLADLLSSPSMSKSQNPTIFLSGVNSRDVRSLVDFLYSGKMVLDAGESLLALVRDLQIDGMDGRKGGDLKRMKLSEGDEYTLCLPTPAKPANYSGEKKPSITESLIIQGKVSKLDGGFLCIPCGIKVKTRDSIRTHFQEKHPKLELVYVCPVCEMTFEIRRYLRRHVGKIHSDYKNLEMDKCVYKKEDWIKEDKEALCLHSSSKPANYFVEKKPLIMESMIMQGKVSRLDSGFLCIPCHVKFKTRESIRTHFQEKHPELKVVYVCPVCEMTFEIRRYLRRHVSKIHTDYKNLELDKCAYKKEDWTKEDKDSMCLHSSAKPANYFVEKKPSIMEIMIMQGKVSKLDGGFLCIFCRKEFKKREAIRRHFKNKHPESEVVYVCPVCEMTFKIRQNLGNHVSKMHSEFKTRKLDKCINKKEDWTKEDEDKCLTSPVKQVNYSGEMKEKKPLIMESMIMQGKVSKLDGGFFCIPCCIKFKSRETVRRHLQEKHTESEVVYICPICETTFEIRRSILKHVKDVHSDFKGLQLDKCAYKKEEWTMEDEEAWLKSASYM